MRVFLDSSAYAKRFIDESGSSQIETICIGATSLVLSILCYPEIISALNRRRREKVLSSRDYGTAKSRLAQEIQDIDIINITSSVLNRTVSLLEKNALRTMDAIHIASALQWEAELFVTSDSRQVKAAGNARLATKLVN